MINYLIIRVDFGEIEASVLMHFANLTLRGFSAQLSKCNHINLDVELYVLEIYKTLTAQNI